MTRYVGIFDEHGYRVLAGAEPLALHHHYAKHRNWRTDNGLRQLALDLLIDALEEPISAAGLAPRPGYHAADYTTLAAAWLPHLHHTAQLFSLARSNGYSRWELTDSQILAWLWDWMHEQHLYTAKPRYRFQDCRRALTPAYSWHDIGALEACFAPDYRGAHSREHKRRSANHDEYRIAPCLVTSAHTAQTGEPSFWPSTVIPSRPWPLIDVVCLACEHGCMNSYLSAWYSCRACCGVLPWKSTSPSWVSTRAISRLDVKTS